jgi:hypothetical protein
MKSNKNKVKELNNKNLRKFSINHLDKNFLNSVLHTKTVKEMDKQP